MTKIRNCVASQYVMSVLQKGQRDGEWDIWHHFGFESFKELHDAVRLVACVLHVKLSDADINLDIGNVVNIESPISNVQAVALPF